MLYRRGEPLFPMHHMGLLAKELRFLNMKQVLNNIKNNHCIVQCLLQAMMCKFTDPKDIYWPRLAYKWVELL